MVGDVIESGSYSLAKIDKKSDKKIVGFGQRPESNIPLELR